MAELFRDFPIARTDDDILDEMVTYLQSNLPGWTVSKGQLENWLLAATARIASSISTAASDVPREIFEDFGRSLAKVPRREAVGATMFSTWTMVDAQGYTIEAGTLVGYRTTGDQLVGFTVRDDVAVPPGSVSTTIGQVILDAVEVGEDGNVVPNASILEVMDPSAFVASVVSASVSAGGADAESAEDYRNRLAQELTLLSPKPILPNDYAVLARRIPGVHRVMAINGYNPVDNTLFNARYMGLAAVDVNGAEIPLATKNAVIEYLDSMRETNVNIGFATVNYTNVDVDFQIKVSVDFDPVEVVTAAEEAVTTYLSPAIYGGGDQNPPRWDPLANTIRIYAVSALISAIPGVEYVNAINIQGSPTNLTLPGIAPLPMPQNITGTAVDV